MANNRHIQSYRMERFAYKVMQTTGAAIMPSIIDFMPINGNAP